MNIERVGSDLLDGPLWRAVADAAASKYRAEHEEPDEARAAKVVKMFDCPRTVR